MKVNRSFLIICGILVVGIILSLTGCQDKQSPNNEFSVIFYTSIYPSPIEASTIETVNNVDDGSKVERPEDPTASGANFAGWYKEKECVNEWDFDTDTVTSSVVIYAKWELSDFNINYIFDAAGGDLIDDPIDTYSVTDMVVLPKADRLGSLFLGWILTPVNEYKVGDVIIKSTEGYYSDLNLYALFENSEYSVRFRSLNDSVSNPKTHVVEFTSEIDFPVLEDTSTETFVGWFSQDGTETGEWGFQYENGNLFMGKALSYDEVTGEWEFLPQGVIIFAKWESK